MQRVCPGRSCALALVATASLTCVSEPSTAIDGDSALRAEMRQTRHPPQWTPWTTDGAAAIETADAFLVGGVRCSGRYCDDIGFLAVESGYTPTSSWWTDSFSEEGQNFRICDSDGFVTGIQYSSRYCDNVSL